MRLCYIFFVILCFVCLSADAQFVRRALKSVCVDGECSSGEYRQCSCQKDCPTCSSGYPSPAPTPQPTPSPIPTPTPQPTQNPTPAPTPQPTPSPTPAPTPQPAPSPTPAPTPQPTPSPTLSPVDAMPLTCTQEYCASQTTRIFGPTQCDDAGIEFLKLDVFTYNEVDMIELLVPTDPAYAAAVVLTVPHGGYEEPNFIRDRVETDPLYCAADDPCVTIKDSYTLDIALLVVNKFIENYCKVPYVVINKLHRKKLDPNREIGEAAQGDAIAEQAWWAFHNFVQDAQTRVISAMGSVENLYGYEGARGILFDLHGYAGRDWDPMYGGPFIHYGYRMSSTSLNPDQYCPLDDRSRSSTSTIGTFSHARWLPNQSYECLIRGPNSLGTLVPAIPSMGLCGTGLPSYNFPNPLAVGSDPAYCRQMWPNSTDPGTCGYYTGGYTVDAHEYVDWTSGSGIMFNTVMAELLPKCIRFNSVSHPVFAHSLSVGLCSFLNSVFGGDIFAAATC